LALKSTASVDRPPDKDFPAKLPGHRSSAMMGLARASIEIDGSAQKFE
jgi:hypothetical protein